MDYNTLAKKYKPEAIKTLLVGEAPPPDGKTYFYKIPDVYSIPKSKIEDDSSLRATIFNHYFGRRPNDRSEYEKFLICLQKRGVFLIDIYDENLVIKKRGQPFNGVNIEKLVSAENIKKLKDKISKLVTPETKVIFVIPTGRPYTKELLKEFPNISCVNWKCFRLDIHEAEECED